MSQPSPRYRMPGTDEYSEDMARSLSRIVRAVEHRARRFTARSRLTVSQWMALRALLGQGTCTAGELANRVGISRGTATGILNHLQAENLVQRQRRSKDRRRVYVSLTPKGRDVASRLEPPFGEPLSRLVSDIPESDRPRTADALRRVARVLEQ